MTNAFGVDTQAKERLGEVTENYSQTMNMQRGQLAILHKENEHLKAHVLYHFV